MGKDLSKHTISVLTGRRSDYGVMYPVYKAIQADPELQLDLIVTEMHNWPQYGETWKNIQADKIPFRQCWVCNGGMTNVMADVMFELDCNLWVFNKPDAVIVMGDTLPMLAGAIVVQHLNIPVFHVHGGDTTGSLDNHTRDAITAFADYHFPCLPAHAERLIKMGVWKDSVKVVGPLGIYAMKDAQYLPEAELRKTLELSDKPIILVIQHPVTSEASEAGKQMQSTLDAIATFTDYEPVVIYPNSDTGSEDMIEAINKSRVKSFKSLPYLTFVSLLKYSSVIVGNSSCGLIEAPYFGVPCVNIGTRQNGRLGDCFKAGYYQASISKAIDSALSSFAKLVNLNSLDIDGPKVIVDTLKEVLCKS